jgi:hypothetical protein
LYVRRVLEDWRRFQRCVPVKGQAASLRTTAVIRALS